MKYQETILNTPKDLKQYTGKYIIFFTEDKNPKVLFSTYFFDEAYAKAEDIKKEENRQPIVYHVQDTSDINLSQMVFNL